MQDAVLVFVRKEGQVLLGFKKRGFGEGKWNGLGGKIQEGESLEEAARREAEEEAGIRTGKLKEMGLLKFHFGKKHSWKVHVFETREFDGTPAESEEMRVQWFPEKDIPFDGMWADDRYWLPLVLQGKEFEAEFWFDEKGERLERKKVEERG